MVVREWCLGIAMLLVDARDAPGRTVGGTGAEWRRWLDGCQTRYWRLRLGIRRRGRYQVDV